MKELIEDNGFYKEDLQALGCNTPGCYCRDYFDFKSPCHNEYMSARYSMQTGTIEFACPECGMIRMEVYIASALHKEVINRPVYHWTKTVAGELPKTVYHPTNLAMHKALRDDMLDQLQKLIGSDPDKALPLKELHAAIRAAPVTGDGVGLLVVWKAVNSLINTGIHYQSGNGQLEERIVS